MGFRRQGIIAGYGMLVASALVLATFSLAIPVAFAHDDPAAPAKATKKADGKDTKPKEPEEDPEIKMGREAHEELLRSGIRLIRDPEIVERVERVGKKVAAAANANPIPASYGSSKFVPYEYRFFVVDDPDVNAFCLPGGYIYVNKGLMNYVQSDDELAGVLGHEVTHASHHHVVKLQKEQSRLNTQMAIGLLAAILARVPTTDTVNLLTGFQLVALQKVNGYGQNAERDADHGGVIVAQKAGYNPVGALTFMERLERDQQRRPDVEMGIFRTHPPEDERAEAMVSQIKKMGLPINRRTVTNSLKLQVRSVTGEKEPTSAPVASMSEVLLEGKVLYRTANTEKAKETAATLDRLFDEDLQLFDVRLNDTTLLVRGEPVLTISAGDATLMEQGNARSAAELSYRTLRNALYRHLLNGG